MIYNIKNCDPALRSTKNNYDENKIKLNYNYDGNVHNLVLRSTKYKPIRRHN
jgi:hypothetical protein